MKKQIISLLIIIFSLISFHTHASEQNWKPAQDGDKIILIRHGINQAKKIGKLFREKKVKINQLLSSQWCRCKDTAKYAFGNFKEFSALNSTYTPPYDQNEKQQIKDLKKYVNNWNGKGGNLVLVTHYVIILAITGETTRSGELVITDKNLKVLSTINTF